MAILYDAKRRVFMLHAGQSTYAFAVGNEGRLAHLYWGGRLEDPASLDAVDVDRVDARGVHQQYLMRQEYRAQEPFDYGEPALACAFSDGVRSVRLRYADHTISGETLAVRLEDDAYPLHVTLWYRLYGDLALIGRWAEIRNGGEKPITVRTAQSATWHLPAAETYRLTHLAGSWGAEYHATSTGLLTYIERRKNLMALLS